MKKLFLIANAVAMTAFLASCGGSDENAEGTGADSTQVDTTAAAMEIPEEYISVPSPDEMFSFIKDLGGKGNTSTLNNPDNLKNYIDTRAKALNFGIYATDFLYCSTFDYGTEGLKYFVNVKKLGDELGISGVISESMADRIKQNIGKNDSLTDISNTLYYSAIAELEKSEKANVLALVIVGGWVESMHLVTSMQKKFKAGDPGIDRIAEQKYTLDNLLEYLDKYKDDASVAGVIAQLNELKEVYSQLKEESASGSVSAKGNAKVLGGGTTITITEDQYKAISEKVKSIRESFTSGK